MKEEIDDILGAIDTRDEVVRQLQTLITQHLFRDYAFTTETHIPSIKSKNGTTLHLIAKSHNCIDKVKGHLWSQKYEIRKNVLEVEKDVVAMKVDQCCPDDLTAHFQPCPNLHTFIKAQDHDFSTFSFLLLYILNGLMLKHEKRERNFRFHFYVCISDALTNHFQNLVIIVIWI